ncbi:AlbA family DNA-binding domain-containing protein [Sedimentimonas flavescens]|uniref:AlbA family DNA-binding domain-containing protein n=1 Tax=Sedimentimonas flavescens TaxID=2851012 RepID=UPI0021A91D49|nr:ATP-binding protein [Sedimentimonas flavescens]MCT2541080.1 ATP-binding protein [Sedimentimonas flavescens]
MPNELPLDFSHALKFPNEDLDVEFKRSLPLNDSVGKAKLAKEICALANHGGGWIVLGREDDGTYPDALPEEIVGVDQDQINQISAAYLQPSPHCTVSAEQPNGIGFSVPVIWVPSCGASPVCGKKNGPNDARGRTQGVVKGVHYTRKAGPVSAPIETPDEWQDVIRRCVLSDKTSLLSALSTMIEQPRPAPEIEEQNVFDADFEHVVARWKEEAQKYPYEVDLTNCFVAYGFQLVDAEPVTTDQLTECLRHRPQDKRSGYTFFDNDYNSPNRPFVIEVADHDGLEVHVNTTDFDHRAIWRLSECLSGTEVISYWEDTDWIKSAVENRSSRTWERGQHIWTAQQIAYANSFLATVKHIADHFNFTGDIRIRVFFSGLSGRNLKSPNIGVYYSMDYRAHQNTKQVDFVVHVEDLSAETRSSTIASMIQPMNKLTQGPAITAESVVRSIESR